MLTYCENAIRLYPCQAYIRNHHQVSPATKDQLKDRAKENAVLWRYQSFSASNITHNFQLNHPRFNLGLEFH
jgi:hypothetical protein